MASLVWRVTSSSVTVRGNRNDSVVSTSGSSSTTRTVFYGFPASSPLRKSVILCRDEVSGRKRKNLSIRAVATKTPGSDDYNVRMKRQMMNPYEYHHELGMYYTRITPTLIVGSQPQSPSDIEKLFQDEKVGAVLNLQQDKDVEYWGIDLQSIIRRCEELGVWHIRRPARDFDGDSLRAVLPIAVSALEHALEQGRTVYVHCTAGLGRAPAVAIAYLFWFNNMNLEDAYQFITSKRPCGPEKEAIRGATYDLAKIDDQWQAPFDELPDHAFNDVAGWERQVIQERVRSQRWYS
ncbi:unnamed protein product [Calypogeia fissa]